jgi:hypothetical protein
LQDKPYFSNNKKYRLRNGKHFSYNQTSLPDTRAHFPRKPRSTARGRRDFACEDSYFSKDSGLFPLTGASFLYFFYL